MAVKDSRERDVSIILTKFLLSPSKHIIDHGSWRYQSANSKFESYISDDETSPNLFIVGANSIPDPPFKSLAASQPNQIIDCNGGQEMKSADCYIAICWRRVYDPLKQVTWTLYLRNGAGDWRLLGFGVTKRSMLAVALQPRKLQNKNAMMAELSNHIRFSNHIPMQQPATEFSDILFSWHVRHFSVDASTRVTIQTQFILFMNDDLTN